jgi:hypothetical protein
VTEDLEKKKGISLEMKHTPLNSKKTPFSGEGGGLSRGMACSTPCSSTVTVTELTG